MQELDLGDNQLSGEIPAELGRLAILGWLRLHENQLNGEIPAELGNLANLTGLFLDGNQLSGEIPPELGNLASLWHLFLEGNQLSGCVPSSLQDQVLDSSYLGGLRFCAGPPLAQTSPETDREALVAFYNLTGGPNWEESNNLAERVADGRVVWRHH